MPRRPITRPVTRPVTTPPVERLTVSTLRPGYLVGLKTSVTGNVKYNKEIIEPEHKVRSGATRARWQTERTITDPEEHVKATQVRMKARMAIVNVCAKSAFGLLCPEENVPRLEAAIAEARKLANDFNRRSNLTRIGVYVISGRIARDDVEAARAINSEVREILANMAEGVKNLDAKKIRDSATRARNIESMIAPGEAGKIKTAIDKGRAAARKIVKAGEDAAQEVDREAIRAISSARTAFLDVDMEEGEDMEIELPEAAPRELDLIDLAELPPVLADPIRRRRSREGV
jgi:hypothetical protein